MDGEALLEHNERDKNEHSKENGNNKEKEKE